LEEVDEMKAQEKVGRIMTVDRVRELNAKDWFYRILKENPNLTGIYPGIENEILEGAIDHHIHAYPDFVYRTQDMIEVSIDAVHAKMRAVGFKDHFFNTGGCAYLVQKHIDYMVKKGDLQQSIQVYGGIGINFRMDVEMVQTALRYPNIKMIWFPTFKSTGYYRAVGQPGGIPMVDEKGKVTPEVERILELSVEAKVGIGLGHTDFQELYPIAKRAKEIGARTVLDHPLLELNKLTLDEIQELAGLGVYVGAYCQPMIPSIYQPVCDPMETVELIKKVGAERCIIGGDFGQVLHVKSIEGNRIFVRALLGFGISKGDIIKMFRDNPAKLLWLEG
jgi:hypothetical protein